MGNIHNKVWLNNKWINSIKLFYYFTTLTLSSTIYHFVQIPWYRSPITIPFCTGFLLIKIVLKIIFCEDVHCLCRFLFHCTTSSKLFFYHIFHVEVQKKITWSKVWWVPWMLQQKDPMSWHPAQCGMRHHHDWESKSCFSTSQVAFFLCLQKVARVLVNETARSWLPAGT